MGGIAGFFDPKAELTRDELRGIVRTMAETLRHRGPDGSGEWIDEKSGFALGHRLLSTGNGQAMKQQPLTSNDGRWTIAYDGAIDNADQLVKLLESEGRRTSGNTPAEILLAGIEAWGVETAVKRTNGMFALAAWNSGDARLYLARDRIGMKPLYFGWMKGALVFGSELKALRAHSEWEGRIDRNVVALLMRWGYVPAPYCIYENFFKLFQGCVLSIGKDQAGSGGLAGFSSFPEETASPGGFNPVQYWSARQAVENGRQNPFQGSDIDAVDELESLLKDTVIRPMCHDMPPATFLSGGIDTSTVLALLTSISSKPVKTFTVGFHREEFNEAKEAKAIAAHFGADHHELYLTPEDFMEVIPRLPQLYDEPICDPAHIPMHLISKLAQQSVASCFTGDGGDHVFGGANRYVFGRGLWQKFSWIPFRLRHGMSKGLTSLPFSLWQALFQRLNPVLPKIFENRSIEITIYKFADLLDSSSAEEWCRRASHVSREPHQLVPDTIPLPLLIDKELAELEFENPAERLRYFMGWDIVTPFADQIIAKLDRAVMGASLEGKVPFPDHRVFEFATRLPLSMKIREGRGKWVVRELLYRYIPKEIMDRPKTGFELPISEWLRGPLRNRAEELLDESRLKREGYLDPGIVREKWAEHISGRRDWYGLLWSIFVFQEWLESV